MTISTQSRLLSKVLYLFSFLMLFTSGLKAQICLGLNERADEANPDEVFLDIVAEEFNGIASMQFSIVFDPAVYEPIGLEESNLVGFGAGSTNFNAGEGAIALAWFDQTAIGLTFTEDKPLVTYKFKKSGESTSGFDFSDDPVSIEIATATEVLYNVKSCNTGGNLVPAISGQLFLDDNQNCELEATERTTTLKSWRGWNIAASQNGIYHFGGFIKEDGSYQVRIFPGENLIEIIPPGPFYATCTSSFIINSEDIDIENAFYENLVQITEECPFLEVSLASFPRPACEPTFYFLRYQNNGTAVAEDVYIDLNLDDRIVVTEIDETYLELGANEYRINLGTLGIGERSSILFRVEIPCDISDTETLRNEAQIFPKQSCGIVEENWSGASLKVDGKCDGNQIIFEFENIGNGDMQSPSQYVVIEDAVIFRTQNVQLPIGGKQTIAIPASGATYFIQVEQEEGHPGSYIPSAYVEACGRDENGLYSTGFANRFPEENSDNTVSINYQILPVDNSNTRLLTAPVGYGDEHFVEPNHAIEYTLHFQNAVNNTLEIIDTLSPLLDVTTFKAISANNPYEYTLESGVLKLIIPNALQSNFLDRNSFVKFSIMPKADLPTGSVIRNNATLIYSEERIEETNTVFHTIEEDFIERSTSTINLTAPISQLSVYPNPSNDIVLFTIKDWQPIDYQIRIMDVDGKVVETNTFNSRQYRFQKGDLSSGTYLYRLIGVNGMMENGFFILVD